MRSKKRSRNPSVYSDKKDNQQVIVSIKGSNNVIYLNNTVHVNEVKPIEVKPDQSIQNKSTLDLFNLFTESIGFISAMIGLYLSFAK